MPDLAQGGFRFSIYQRPAPGQSDVNANLPGHHPQGSKTFQPGFINPNFNPGFSSLSFSTLEFMVEQSGVENGENSVMKKSWVSKVWSISPGLKRTARLSVRKQLTQQLPEGCFGPSKCNNVGTFKRK